MNISPPVKRRRSSSPTSARPDRPSLSPSRPVLPPPTPSSHAPAGYPTFPPTGVAGPSSWQSWSRESHRERDMDSMTDRSRERDRTVRRSMDARSPVSDVVSPRMEGIDEGSEAGMSFTREQTTRAPRSMMACTRCRRQKMKCDGPTQVPCRGCRQAGVPCVFENRSQRPKSISTLPARGPPFYPTSSGLSRPLETQPLAGPAFYPQSSQPAPPVTSRQPPADYALRAVKEPQPPHPTSIHSVATARGHTPSASMSAIPQSYYQMPPAHAPPPPQPQQQAYAPRPPSPSLDTRLRNIEGFIRPLTGLPNNVASLQSQLLQIQRTADMTYASVSERLPTAVSDAQVSLRPREVMPEINDRIWQSYRTSAWPLTPWLVGLRDARGLPSLVLAFLGSRPQVHVQDGTTRRDIDDAAVAVHKEVGRLVAHRGEWTREEIRSLGVFATWTSDHALAALAIAEARRQGIERILTTRRSLDDWREWIYLSLMDKLCHVVDFIPPLSSDQISSAWRDRLNDASALDPVVRDRDLKLLTWHEYADNLRAILTAQQALRLELYEDLPARSPLTEVPPSARSGGGDRAVELWKAWAARWETWATRSDTRSDPILSLHRHYATLYTSSPAFLCSSTAWAEMAQTHDGSLQLERSRDAAFAVIQAVCSGEISRTLAFSFGLYRPILGLALLTLLSISAATSGLASPVVSASHLATVLRSTHDTLVQADPVDAASAATAPPPPPGSVERIVRPSSRASRLSGEHPQSVSGAVGEGSTGMGGSLLRELVIDGSLARGREVLGAEPCPDLWKRLLG